MAAPEREPRQYRKDEKTEEKEEEKRDEKSWDEKWRHDPVNAGSWAFIFIWVGIVLLGRATGFGPDTFAWWSTWALALAGAGTILLISAVIRLMTPAYRRPLLGNFIVGGILLGVGLTDLTGWGWSSIGAVILIGIGVVILISGVFRKRR